MEKKEYRKEKVDLFVEGNLAVVVNKCKGGGKNTSYICYADESEYEPGRVVQGDYVLQGECGIVAATGGISYVGEGK